MSKIRGDLPEQVDARFILRIFIESRLHSTAISPSWQVSKSLKSADPSFCADPSIWAFVEIISQK